MEGLWGAHPISTSYNVWIPCHWVSEFNVAIYLWLFLFLHFCFVFIQFNCHLHEDAQQVRLLHSLIINLFILIFDFGYSLLFLCIQFAECLFVILIIKLITSFIILQLYIYASICVNVIRSARHIASCIIFRLVNK